MHVFSVAQICNLYRRIAFCGRSASASALEFLDAPSDYKSAIRQIINLGYDVALCAKRIPFQETDYRYGEISFPTA
jgi:hypothetical protein